MPKPSLHFYSYDAVLNPWLGGGGAYRDLEILSQYGKKFRSVTIYYGYYPGAIKEFRKGIQYIPLGFGQSEIVSRVSYVLMANLRILFLNRKTLLGVAMSIYAPLFAILFHRKKLFGIIHHLIGKNWKSKLGQVGILITALESYYTRIPNNLLVLNDSLVQAIHSNKPEANILRSANGFNPDLLNLKDDSNPNEPMIVFIGRLDIFMKGLDLLCAAFEKMAPKYPNLKMILAGRGNAESEKNLRLKANEMGLQNRIELRTNISDLEKGELLSHCSFYCSPSRYEGWGIAALEANAAGKPVVVSEASGFKNSISNGYSGIRVDIGEMDLLVKAMESLLDDEPLRKKMGMQAREWSLQFTWEAIAEKELNWLEASDLT